MKCFSKILVGLLVVANSFTYQLMTFNPPAVKAAAPVAQTSQKEILPPKSGKIELTDKRTQNSKTYLKSNGSKELVMSQGSIHYKDKQGSWQDIDTNLTDLAPGMLSKIAGSDYRNKANGFNLSISKDINQKLYSLESGGGSISISLPKNQGQTNTSQLDFSKINPLLGSKAVQKDNKVEYKAVYPGIDYSLYSMSDGLKEYVIYNKPSDKNQFAFDLNISNAYYKQQANGSYNFYKNGTQDLLFRMPNSYAWDSKGGKDSIENSYSYNVKTEIIPNGSGYKILMTVDKSWLTSPSRVFPITIDPSFYAGSLEDTYVQTGYPDIKAWDQRYMWIGQGYGNKGLMRSLVLFNIPVPDLEKAKILSSRFEVYQQGNCTGICQTAGVSAFTTSNFNPWESTWNNQPAILNKVGGGFSSTIEGWFTIDITAAAQHWMYSNTDGSVPGGLEFVQDGDTTNWGYRTWVAQNFPDAAWAAPKLTIEYNDYNARYITGSGVNGVAGTTVDVPITVQNTGNNNWSASNTGISYHLFDSAGRQIISDGEIVYLPRDLARGGTSATLVAKVKIPVTAGAYTIRWDLIQPGLTWFSSQGVPTADQALSVSLPSFSSVIHMGSEDYYSKLGPVDLATGALTFSSTDMSIPSTSGSVSISRSYNSSDFIKRSTQDSNGYIQNWLINGLYREGDRGLRLSNNYLGDDSKSRPNEGTSSNNNLWFSYNSGGPLVNLNQAFAQNGTQQNGAFVDGAAYAHVYLYSPSNRDVQLRLGSDDGARLWLDSNLIFEADYARGSVPDQDVINTSLSKGWHSLTLKVTQLSGDWNFYLRFTNRSGVPYTDMTCATNNPELFETDGVLGKGWTMDFEDKIFFTDPNNIYIKDASGNVNLFIKNTDGSYRRPAGVSYDLSRNSGGNFSIRYKNGIVKQYNAQGKLAFIADTLGNKIYYRYNIKGQCIKVEDGGRSIVINYTATGGLDSLVDQAGTTIKYAYATAPNGSKHFIGIDYPNVTKYRYTFADPEMRKINSYTNPKGAKTTFIYTGDKVTSISDALNNTTNVAYSYGRTEVTDALLRHLSYEFNQVNLLTYFSNAKGYKEFYQYDGNYNLVATTPVLAENDMYYYKYSYIYDANNNLLSESDPLGHTSTYQYKNNDLIKATSPGGETATYTYSADARRLLLSESDAKANTTRYGYDGFGHMIFYQDAKGNQSKYTYSVNGDVLSQTSAKGETSSYLYDSIGRQTSQTSPMGLTLQYVYNVMSWLNRTISPSGTTLISSYDLNGNKSQDISADGNIVNYKYDKLDRLASVVDQVGATMSYSYDAVGNRIALTDAKAKATTFTYDELNQLKTQTDPAGHTTNVTYDRNGNVVATQDENGAASRASYNSAGQLTSSSNSAVTTSLSYDKNGNPIKVNSSSGNNVGVAYDANGLAISVNSSLSGNNSFSYDPNNNLAHSTTATNNISYGYDANGALSSVQNNLSGVGQVGGIAINRDKDGKITSQSNINGGITSYKYDSSVRITEVSTQQPSRFVSSRYRYTYDKVSNVLSETDVQGNKLSYTYDARGELISDNGSTYKYDAMGNRTKRVQNGVTSDYLYDEAGDANRLTQINRSNGGSSTFEYDKSGNITKKVEPTSGVSLYTYNQQGQFTKAVLSDKTVVEYKYDDITQLRSARIATSPDGTVKTTKFVYDGSKLVSETDENGKVRISYTWDQNENLASFSYTGSNGRISNYCYLKNAKGDIIGLSDSGGNTMIEYAYDAWGSVTTARQTMPLPGGPTLDPYMNPRLYGGYWYDTTLKMYFMKTRMYDPGLGRFLSPDTSGSGLTALAHNPYIYCANNPISRLDPNGKSWFSAITNFVSGAAQVIAQVATVVWDNFSNAVNTAVNYLANSSIPILSWSARQTLAVSDWAGSNPWRIAGASLACGIVVGVGLIGGLAAVEASTAYIASLTGYGAVTAAGEASGGGYAAVKIAEPVLEKNGGVLSGITEHGLVRIIERGVSPRIILDTIRYPDQVVTAIGKYGPQLQYIGSRATIVISQSGSQYGKIITAWLR